MFDVAIIGCGVVGAAAAYELSRYKLKIAVLERGNDVSQGTTKANSAIIHAGYDPEPGTIMAKLNPQGNRMAKEICQKLDVPYRQIGSLVLAFTPQELPVLHTLYERGVQNGVPGLRLLSPGEVSRMEPNVNRTAGALYAPTAGIVSPWEYALAMMETAVKNGVSLFLENEVHSIQKKDGGFSIQTGSRVLESRFILNAAGTHADLVHNMAAQPSFRIVPDRGEYYLLDKSQGECVSHVIFQCPTKVGKGTLVSPTVHGNLIVGPNNEPPRGADDVSTTAAGLEQVARNAKKSVPGLNLRESIRNFAGVRAASDRDDFIVEEAPGAPGFFDLAGIKSPGLSCAPALAKLAAELLREAGLKLSEKEEFLDERRRIRFSHLSAEEKAALIRREPTYGHVLCRCETVTEGEILAALKGPIPPRTLDAVKRRTSAGMGRCQGSFCGPRIVELLARELGTTPDEILQDGPGSYLLTGETKGGCADV